MKKIIPFICSAIVLGGCSMTSKENEFEAKEDESEVVENNDVIVGKGGIKLDANDFVRVQDYNGDGYTLRNSGKTKGIIADKHDVIEEEIITYFKDKQKTDVIVHNIIPAVDAATVFVESKGEPHFYSYAMVPVDQKTKTIKRNSVFMQEGEIESDITSAMFAMVYAEEFANLDAYLEKVTKEYSLIGLTKEAFERIGGNGYSTPCYFVNAMFQEHTETYQAYIENPHITKEEIEKRFSHLFTPDNISYGITLYMAEDGKEPDEEIYDKIISDLEKLNNIPPGSYSLVLHDNLINAKVGSASKGNSIHKTALNEVIKEE